MKTRTVFNYKYTGNNWNAISKGSAQLFVHNEHSSIIFVKDGKEPHEMDIALSWQKLRGVKYFASGHLACYPVCLTKGFSIFNETTFLSS